jgi:hypothetical protein
MAHKETPGRDSEGRYRRYLGWKRGDGKFIQHLFRLGRDKTHAEAANVRLEQLWQSVEARWRRLRGEGRTDEPCPLWDEVTLAIGNAIAKGQADCVITPPAEAGHATALVTWLAVLQTQFPMIGLRLPEGTMERGIDGLRRQERIADESRKLSQRLQTVLGATCGQTLHEALDAYSAYIAEKYKDKPSERPQKRAINLLRQHTDNPPLDRLDADRIETWLAYWCRRPPSHRSGQPLAFTTVRNLLIVLRQFLRWLNRSPQFEWSLPAAFTFPRCRVARLPAERLRKRVYWKRSELRLIWQYARPWERALILLALNCGFGKKEIATLQPAEVVGRKGRTYVRRFRTKTGAWGEWVLWPETLDALDYLKQFRPADATYAVANRDGRPLTGATKDGNENQVIKNHWDRLMRRVLADHPGFHRLPFKCLRKTGATYLRRLHVANAAELASMYLAHGEASDSCDPLLPAYAARPWTKLHRALLRLRAGLLPVLTSVRKPWEPPATRVSPRTVARVKELRAGGMKLEEIAREVGLHWVTVGKICRRENATGGGKGREERC